MYFPMPKPIQMAADGYKAIQVVETVAADGRK